jgi:hypothetical protein
MLLARHCWGSGMGYSGRLSIPDPTLKLGLVNNIQYSAAARFEIKGIFSTIKYKTANAVQYFMCKKSDPVPNLDRETCVTRIRIRPSPKFSLGSTTKVRIQNKRNGNVTLHLSRKK